MVRFIPVGIVEIRERFAGDDISSTYKLTSDSSFEVKALFTLTPNALGGFQNKERPQKAQILLLVPLNCYTPNGFSITGMGVLVRICSRSAV